MTPEQLQRIKHFYAVGAYRDAGVISQLVTELEYQTAANEQADRIIAGLRVANERLAAELDQLRAGLDDLLEKLRQDEAEEVVRGTGRSMWPGEG